MSTRPASSGALQPEVAATEPPLFADPVHVGRPNTGSREMFLKLAGEMFDRQWFTNDGPLVREFEQTIADYLGVRHCVAMCNGTLALEIGIRALGLTGEVIVPSHTFVATAHALYWQGITPVFADIDPQTQNLDPDAVRRMITPRTTGIVGVHLWGRPAPTAELQTIADDHGLRLMFDAAHAFGCSHDGKSIGGFGELEVLSFHATKFFNTFEGGAVVTNNDELAGAMRLMRNFGFEGYDNVVHPGTNGKMTEVCAAMGLANFEILGSTIESNRAKYEQYAAGFLDVPGVKIMEYDPHERSNYQYVVAVLDEDRTSERDVLVARLHTENVLARKYFWPGCHRMKPYRELFPHAGLVLPHSEAVSSRLVVLPTGAAVTSDQIDVIIRIVSDHMS